MISPHLLRRSAVGAVVFLVLLETVLEVHSWIGRKAFETQVEPHYSWGFYGDSGQALSKRVGLIKLKLDEALRQRVRTVIRDNTTPRHVPAKILAVPEVPRTKSGKIVELAVRSVVHGEIVTNTEALANPAALAYFADIDELGED